MAGGNDSFLLYLLAREKAKEVENRFFKWDTDKAQFWRAL